MVDVPSETVKEDHSWATFSNAIEVEAVPADIHQLTGRWVRSQVSSSADRLVGTAKCRED
jgi:hypothetical protein